MPLSSTPTSGTRNGSALKGASGRAAKGKKGSGKNKPWAAGADRAWRRGVPRNDMTVLIREMGGPNRVGEVTNVSHSTVCCWQRRQAFPANHARKLILVYPDIDPRRIMALTAQKKTPVDNV